VQSIFATVSSFLERQLLSYQTPVTGGELKTLLYIFSYCRIQKIDRTSLHSPFALPVSHQKAPPPNMPTPPTVQQHTHTVDRHIARLTPLQQLSSDVSPQERMWCTSLVVAFAFASGFPPETTGTVTQQTPPAEIGFRKRTRSSHCVLQYL
jgi:hypothetical protein